MDYGIGICYLTPTGRFIARLRGKSKGNILLRRKQYRVADDENQSLLISKNVISAKIYNEKWTIERYIRQYENRIDITHLESLSCLKVNTFIGRGLNDMFKKENLVYDFEKMVDIQLREKMKKIWNDGLQKIDLTTVGQIIGVSVSDLLTNTNTTFDGWE